jgi:hypothetical protein
LCSGEYRRAGSSGAPRGRGRNRLRGLAAKGGSASRGLAGVRSSSGGMPRIRSRRVGERPTPLTVAEPTIGASPQAPPAGVSAQEFLETDHAHRDARRVGTTWKYVRRDGGPDRRFNDNVELAVMAYRQLRSESGHTVGA